MAISTNNPATGELMKTFEPLKATENATKLNLAQQAFDNYRYTSLQERSQLLQSCAFLKD